MNEQWVAIIGGFVVNVAGLAFLAGKLWSDVSHIKRRQERFDRNTMRLLIEIAQKMRLPIDFEYGEEERN